MILGNKTIEKVSTELYLLRQKKFFNYRSNKLTLRRYSSYCLEKNNFLKMATHFDVKGSHNPKLSTTNQLNDQRYSVVGKIPYSSDLNHLESNETYSYDGLKFFQNDKNHKSVDLNDYEYRWVKEAMEVEHESYEKKFVTYLPNMKSVVAFYKHKLTGLTLVSFRTNDSNQEMCFDVSAPTFQFNDRGCTHVVEHSVLIRTKGYDVFNSFYNQVAGTYHSFFNALFFKNRTRFYFASLNEKAFYQLADQFLESFFRPAFLWDKEILSQEGWHYKVTKSDDKKVNTKEVGVDVHGRHVTFSGVVYNEMKLRLDATPLSRGLSVLDHNLFTNTFKYDSGGNPEDVVDLTQEELTDFYKMYYGPRTATVYFHGPHDVYKRLNFVDEFVRKHNVGVKPDPKTGKFSHEASSDVLKKVSVFEEYKETPKYVKTEYNALNKDEDFLMMGWVLDPKFKSTHKYDLDPADKLAFEVLKHMLLDSPQGVLQKALLESNLGSRVVGPGLEDVYPLYPHMTFKFGLDGVKFTEQTREDNVKKFEQVVFKALKHVVDNGFKREAVEAALNKVEFKHTEQNYRIREHRQGYYPKGLTLLRFFHPQLEHERDPLEFMKMDKLLTELRTRVTLDPKYLPNLVKVHMLNNTTRVTLHLQAVESKEFEKSFNKKVVEKLKSRLSHLSREEVDKLEKEYNDFKQKRERPQDSKAYEVYPDFDPSEVKKQTQEKKYVYRLSENSLKEKTSLKRTSTDQEQVEVTVLANPLESNGVLYLDYAVSLDELSLDDLKHLYLFSLMLQESGTDVLTPEELSYVVDKNLGGLSVSTFFSTESNNHTYDDPKKGLGYLVVRSKSLKQKADKMVDVVNDLLVNANFSNSKKGLLLLKRSVKQLEAELRYKSHVQTLRRLARRFSVGNYADEVVNGYSQLVFLKDELLPKAEKDWSQVESKLNEMRSKLLKLKHLTVNLTGDQELLETFLKNSQSLYKKLSSTFESDTNSTKRDKVWVNEVLIKKLLESSNQNELLVMPVRTNFVGVGGKVFDSNDKQSGEHSVALHYLMRSYLYRLLRSLGGSYGVHVYLMNTGHVALVSYADPNFLETLDVFKKVPEAMKEAFENLSDKGMKMHVVGTLASMDKQLHPEDKAWSVLNSFLRGETQEFSENFRKEVEKTTKQVFQDVERKFKESNDWQNVCSLVNRASAETAPSNFKKLH